MSVEIIVRVLNEEQRRFSIPKTVRKQLGIEPGDYLKISVEKIPLNQSESGQPSSS